MYVRPLDPESMDDSDLAGAVSRLYDGEVAKAGHVRNLARLFSLNPAAYDAWSALLASIGRMDRRRYELVTLAAAAALRCRYCVGAHAAIIESSFYPREQLERIVADFRKAGLDRVDVAVMSLAETVALHAYRVTPGDIDRLRRLGLADAEVFDVVVAAAARCFFSKTLDALGAEPDSELAATLPLFDLLPIQRPASRA